MNYITPSPINRLAWSVFILCNQSNQIPPSNSITQQIDIARRNLREFGAACITPPIFAALLEAGELDGRQSAKADQTAVEAWWRELINNQEA